MAVRGDGHRLASRLTPVGRGDHVPAEPAGAVDQRGGVPAKPETPGDLEIDLGVDVAAGIGQGRAEPLGSQADCTRAWVCGRGSALEHRAKINPVGDQHGGAHSGRVGEERPAEAGRGADDALDRLGPQRR